MIDTFAILLGRIGLKPTAEELADMLWLAGHLDAPPEPEVEPAPEEPEEEASDKEPQKKRDLKKKPDTEESKPEQEEKAPPPPDPSPKPASMGSGLYLPSRQKEETGSGSGGTPFRSPGTTALPGSLEISRALRPLMRRVPSRMQFEIDIERTVQQIADEGNWSTVMRPRPTRWLDLALVIDQTSSMVIWKQAIDEMKRLLERQGAFRTVHTWGFSVEDNGRIQLHVDQGEFNPNPSERPARELIDPMGQRLILVVSDCVAPCWHNGKAAEMIAMWGHKGQVAIVQMLPHHLWSGTGLGGAVPAHLYSIKPGTPNKYLLSQVPWEWMYEPTDDTFPVPVITSEPTTLRPWAKMIAGKGKEGAQGYLLPLQPTAGLGPVSGAGPQNESPSDRVDHFRKTASPVAVKLAGFLAASPLSLPVMRLVQRVMLPESRQTHLAEVFLSGLIYQKSTRSRQTHPDDIEYEFHDGVREHLLSTVLVSDAVNVLTHVSDYINRKTGKGLNFRAILSITDPDAVEETPIEIGSKPFANVALKVLRRLGGRYAKLSTLLEQGGDAIAPAKEPEVKRQDRRVKFLVKDPAKPGVKRELEYRFLIVGEFDPSSKLREDRDPFQLYTIRKKEDLDEVIEAIRPRLVVIFSTDVLGVETDDGEEGHYTLDLSFNSMKDFHPDAIVEQVPELKRLKQVRHSLLLFKTHLVSFPDYKLFLEDVLAIYDEDQVVLSLFSEYRNWLFGKLVREEWHTVFEGEENKEHLRALSNQIIKAAHSSQGTHSPSGRKYEELIPEALGWYSSNLEFITSFLAFYERADRSIERGQKITESFVDQFISEVDEEMGRIMDAILHQEDFQKLEGAWRGLDYLVRNTAFSTGLVSFDVMDVSKEQLEEDLYTDGDKPFEDSALWEIVYHQAYNAYGVDPYTCIIADYQFHNGERDVFLLNRVSSLCEQAQLLFIGNVSPWFFGLESYADFVKNLLDEHPLYEKDIANDMSYIYWNQLRDDDRSRYLGLTLPRFAGRLFYRPYVDLSNNFKHSSYLEPVNSFNFVESTKTNGKKEEGYALWVNGSFAVASVLARNFEEYGWNAGVVEGEGTSGSLFRGMVKVLPNINSLKDIEAVLFSPIEASVWQEKARELDEFGLISLVPVTDEQACFFDMPSMRRPKVIRKNPDATTNDAIASKIHYTLLKTRLGHHLMRHAKTHVGRNTGPAELESELTLFLSEYLTNFYDLSDPDVFARPLRSFKLEVYPREDRPEVLEIVVEFRPHVVIMGLDASLRLLMYYN